MGSLKLIFKGLSICRREINKNKASVGEKSTNIGFHKGGRPLGRRSYFGGLSLSDRCFILVDFSPTDA